jgi:hypothetical protein
MKSTKIIQIMTAGLVSLLLLSSCAAPSDFERARIADCEQLAFSDGISGPPLTANDVSDLSTKFTKVSETLATILITFSVKDFDGNTIKFRHQCSVNGFDVSTDFHDYTPQ